MDLVVLIPAYKPGPELPQLVQQLVDKGMTLVVVNDGSGASFDQVFAQVRAYKNVHLLAHYVNLGKGAALKTGMNYAMTTFPDCIGVVTADADGQHPTHDILRVAAELKQHPKSLIIGARKFSGNVPLRSAIGNKLTRTLFRFLVGPKLTDTQTGLRGIPGSLVPHLLRIRSNTYEFEFDMLIRLHGQSVPFREVPIDTVYIDDNRGSHFNPIFDSLKIYFLLFRFVIASLGTVIVDNLVFFICMRASHHILLSTALARLVAGAMNFFLAYRFVFKPRNQDVKVALLRYVTSVIVLGLISYGFVTALLEFHYANLYFAKLATESLLFFASFSIQKTFIFVSSPRQSLAKEST